MKQRNEPILVFLSIQDLEAHMTGELRGSKEFWLKLSKVGASETTVSKSEAIEAALCCGWIDGQLEKFDEHYFLVRMTPRRPGSRWSAKNRAAAERLAQEGRLKPAGVAEVEAAKSDGRWAAAYDFAGKGANAARFSGGFGVERSREPLLRNPGSRKSICGHLSCERRQTARDAGEAHRTVCTDVGSGRDASSSQEGD